MLQVTVPPGFEPGQEIIAQDPDGAQFRVTIPPGHGPGQTFLVQEEVEEEEQVPRRKSQEAHWKQQRSRSMHRGEDGVVDSGKLKARLQERAGAVAALNQAPHFTRAPGEPSTSSDAPKKTKKSSGAPPEAPKGKASAAAGAAAAASEEVPASFFFGGNGKTPEAKAPQSSKPAPTNSSWFW